MSRSTRLLAGLTAVVALAAAGCSDMYLADDIDLDFDFNPLEGASDTLHTPYVLGTQVSIYAHDAMKDDSDEDSWRMESSDESVLRVDSHGDRSIRCTAVGVGTADIRVYDDDGDHVYTGTIEVRAPTRAELYAHGPLLIGRSHEETRVDGPIQVLQGGMATFLVRYFDGDQQLYGNGVLNAESSGADQIDLFEETTFLFENREWLQMRPITASAMGIDLYAGDLPVGHVAVTGVTPLDVDHIELIGESESGADEDHHLVVLAQGYDREGNPIYGIEFLWDVDGRRQSSAGDLYRYDYDPDHAVDLEASYQGMATGITVHMGSGYVSSTNSLGCSAVAGRPARSDVPLLLGFVALGLALAHRRR